MSPALAHAQDDFDQCLQRLTAQAEKSGIPARTVESVLSTVHEQSRVIVADRHQPEFIETFAEYLANHVTPMRIEMGRERLERYSGLLARLEAKYGVPPQYLIALWGLESDYGRVLGDVPVFDSLATLACDTRRGGYFSGELVSALKIVERDAIPLSVMKGSWAGAMGNTQFMPSAYLTDGVDGDGDGVVDLWRSVPDALASAANLLDELGWEPGWRWGREVVLPDGFDYYHAGLDHSSSLDAWRRAGIRKVDGRLIDALDEPASLLLPEGHQGPAFLVYANFRTIMRWNRSVFFALAAARLADRIAGAGPLHDPPRAQPRLTEADIEALQRKLNALGFDSGEPDGVAGPKTRQAVRDWQRSHELIADGHVDAELLQRFGI